MSAAFGWEPYDAVQFTRLLQLALPHVPADNQTFLDAGCGLGTKCLLAAKAGLAPSGVEHDPQLAGFAVSLGVTVWQGDARDFTGYAGYGLVYVNCLFSDETEEAEFERWLQGQLAPGTVLIQVNDAIPPAGWVTVLDERPQFRGIWVKPLWPLSSA